MAGEAECRWIDGGQIDPGGCLRKLAAVSSTKDCARAERTFTRALTGSAQP